MTLCLSAVLTVVLFITVLPTSLFAQENLGLSVTTTNPIPVQNERSQHDNAVLVILDVSGSMKEAVEGGEKRDLARRGLLRTLDTVSGDTVVALELLGQGGMGNDCAATSTAVPFNPFERSSWEQAFDTIRWDGATPLVYSMRAAFQILQEIPAAHRALLIIGDGEESCGEDPVGVARAEAGDIAIHTISLGKRVSNQMVGIAFVTGGTYTRAFDDASFFSATKEAFLAQTLSVGASLRNATEIQDSSNRLEVILDVSNSMWGQIAGRTKIELARNALSGALEDLPSTVNVGFRAYGHRVSVDDKEAGCMDTERLLVPAPGNGPTVSRLANRLTPRGQTPIARALRETAQDVGAEGGAAIILLISDGVESCGGDPVAVAAELRASGLQVILHTVGLGVTGQEAAALAELAEAGGGNYFNAPSGIKLFEGVSSVVRLSAELILQRDNVESFPRDVLRVSGGNTVADSEVLEFGTYSFTNHLFREQRYFAVAGRPGETVTLSGLVCALAIGRTRRGVITYMGSTNMMMGEGVNPTGERVRGTSLLVRGDMGTWSDTKLPVGIDGFARFWIGRTHGGVHRDMIFRIGR